MNDDRNDLSPLELSRLRPYIDVIENATTALGCKVITPWLLAAIALRETHCGWAPGYSPKGSPFGLGDHGHGFGLWQLDDRSNLPRIRRVQAAQQAKGDGFALEVMAREALYVLIEKYSYMVSVSRWRPLAGDEARRAMVAAYNAGQGAVYKRIKAGQDPDVCTASKNYSAYVLAKEAALQKVAPDLFGQKGKP
jgi:hypothetical protein